MSVVSEDPRLRNLGDDRPRVTRGRLGAFGAWPALISVGVLLTFVVVAAAGPFISPYDPNALSGLPFEPPSRAHWFGTDDLGRDQLSRCISAARIAVIVAVCSVALGLIGGTLLGVMAGYRRGWTDATLMRVVDVKFAFPDLVLALVIMAALGPGLATAILAISFVYIPRFARLARTATRTVESSSYVEAARLAGVRTPRIMTRHVLRNISAPLIVMTALSIGTAQLAYAALAFLGFGARPPQADYGTMLAVGRAYMTFDVWIIVFPALCLVAFTVAASLAGDAVRDTVDPRSTWTPG